MQEDAPKKLYFTNTQKKDYKTQKKKDYKTQKKKDYKTQKRKDLWKPHKITWR